MNRTIDVRRAEASDDHDLFEQLASLHIDLIHRGILPLLGRAFLANLYREIASARCGRVYVARQGEEVAGFIAGARDIWKCATGFTVGGYLRLGLLFLTRLPNPRVFGKAFDAFSYPFRKAHEPGEEGVPQDKHRAELLAIAVARSAQGKGVGRMLVAAFEDFLKPQVDRYFVTTNIHEPQSNAFYRMVGFAEAGRRRHHALMLQTYVKHLG